MNDLALPGWRGGDGNAAYLDKTLRFEPVEEWLADDIAFRTLWQIFIRAFFVSLVTWLLFIPVSLIYIAASSGPSAYGGYGVTGGILGVLGFVVPGIVFWVILLFSRRTESVAEWRVLLADRNEHVEAVYRRVAGTLQDRKLPIGWQARRVRTDLGARNVSNRLILTERPCTAIVSVFGYGTSLYLGWTMWRSRRGYELVGRFFADLALSLIGQNEPEQVMLRTERLRAMREAVHAACREGLVVAVEGRHVADWVGFPDGLPPIESERRPIGSQVGASRRVQSTSRRSAPRPGRAMSEPGATGPGRHADSESDVVPPRVPYPAPRPAAAPAPYPAQGGTPYQAQGGTPYQDQDFGGFPQAPPSVPPPPPSSPPPSSPPPSSPPPPHPPPGGEASWWMPEARGPGSYPPDDRV